MIVDVPQFRSLNKLADLPAGRYSVVESIYYGGTASSCIAILSEIIPSRALAAVAADLQVITADGVILYRDFACAPDGAWRDSYGAKAATLGELLPAELSRFRLTQRVGTIVQHDGKGSLTRIDNEEHGHGT
ncbi:hypothetical protein [Massilia sp.]|uniref:hypothetical protein n=1 Tax=Massilia sp. TaxID=1882437 RepID=UPI00352F16F7